MEKRICKALAVAAFASLTGSAAWSQSFSEDFTGWSGTTPLEGWTNTDISAAPGTGPGNLWNFDNNPSNSGGTPPSTPLSFAAAALPLFPAPFANFDSDGFSSGSDPEDAVLTSPVFDATGSAQVTVQFNHAYRHLTGSSWALEAWNGTSWINVAGSSTTSTGTFTSRQILTGATANIDITTQAVAAGANAQIRFRYIGSWSWFWVVDNVSVTVLQPGTPLVSISDASVLEGDSGITNAILTVSTDIPTSGSLNLTYSTQNGTATSTDNDFAAASAIPFSIADGETSTTISLDVNGDFTLESDETFSVNVAIASGLGAIQDGQGVVTIQNDDTYGSPLAFGADFFSGAANEIFVLDAANPLTGTFANLGIPTDTNDLYSGGDFIADDAATFYALDYDSVAGGLIRTIDTATAAQGTGASITGVPAATTIRNMKYDATTGRMWISMNDDTLTGTTGAIGEIDINTGAVTNVLTLTPATSLLAIFVHPTTGQMYGMSAASDSFFAIDKGTGAVTAIGPLGQALDQFSTDGDFSADGSVLYATATFTSPFFNHLFQVNLSTGALSAAANIESGRALGQTSAFGIPQPNTFASVTDWTTME